MAPATTSHEGRYKRVQCLGTGTYGRVYDGTDRENGMKVAVKVEAREKNRISSCSREFYHELTMFARAKGRIFGLVPIHDFCETPTRYSLVMQLEGPDLSTLFNQCGRGFSLKTTLQIGVQVIERLELIHSLHVLHRDIKPHNFVIGRPDEESVHRRNTIRVIDFGLSKEFTVSEGSITYHIPMTETGGITGTAFYASINVHLGLEPSRRDDLESVAYMHT